MAGLEDNIEKGTEEHYIYLEESHDNPLLFMIIPGLIACIEETTRSAGYILIAGAVAPTVIKTAEKVYQAIRGYRRN